MRLLLTFQVQRYVLFNQKLTCFFNGEFSKKKKNNEIKVVVKCD